MSIFIYVLRDHRSCQLILAITNTTGPHTIWKDLNKLHLNITLNARLLEVRRFHEENRQPGENIVVFILRKEAHRLKLQSVYDYPISDFDMIPILERALIQGSPLHTAFVTWCGLAGANYETLRQQILDRAQTESSFKSSNTEVAMVSFKGAHHSRGRSHSSSRSRSGDRDRYRSSWSRSGRSNSRDGHKYYKYQRERSPNAFSNQRSDNRGRSRERFTNSSSFKQQGLGSTMARTSVQNKAAWSKRTGVRERSNRSTTYPYKVRSDPRRPRQYGDNGRDRSRSRSPGHGGFG
jgi:hypothetical protein